MLWPSRKKSDFFNKIGEKSGYVKRLMSERRVHGTEQTMDNGAESYRRFLDGDRGAFDDLVNEYHDNLIFFIYGSVKNITVA